MTSLAAAKGNFSGSYGSIKMRISSSSNSDSSNSISSLLSEETSLQICQSPVRPPADGCKIVLFIMFLHGVGMLLPWNAFINAKEYFQDYKLNTNASATADYRINFVNYVGIAAQLPNTIMSGINVFYQPLSGSGSSAGIGRIAVCIFIEICVCVATIVLSFVDTSNVPNIFFAATIASVVLINCSVGVYQSAAYGLAGTLPMRYSNAIVIGSNACGTVIALVNIISKAASAADPQLAAVYYFAFAIAVLVLCMISLCHLPKLKFFRFHQLQRGFEQQQQQQQQQQPIVLSVQTQPNEQQDCLTAPLIEPGASAIVYSCRLSEDVHVQHRTEADCESLATIRECCACCCFPPAKSPAVCARYWSRYREAWQQSWQHCVSIWCVFFCTLSCFPALQASVESASPSDPLVSPRWFTDVLVFLLFNLFALLGNITSGCVQVPGPRWLAPVVWLRAAVCIPFFLACNLFPSNRPRGFPVLIRSDIGFACGVALFAWSSGHLSSLCLMYAPRSVADKSIADLAAMMCAFCLVLGVMSGVAFGSVLFKVMYVL